MLWCFSFYNFGADSLLEHDPETPIVALEYLMQAGGEFDAFIGELRDQITYLGFDLNPSAVASLKGDAAKFNQHGDVLFSKIDDVNKMITEYIQSIQPK